MRKLAIAAAAAFALAIPGAYALDIHNQDSQDLKITVFPQESGPVTFTLKAGQTKTNACSKTICEVMLGDESGEWVASTKVEDKVIVKGGKLHLQ